jgi:transcriptional repressor NrdR
MRCPKCGTIDDKVIDSRISRDGASIRRRRECLSCTTRFTTYEHVEQADLLVVKRNGAREPFDREKLIRSFAKACEKRPVSMEILHAAADDLATDLEASGQREIPSKLLGLKVMDKLHSVDPVAYVRYVSVYRQFDNVGEFINEIQALERRATRDPMQRKLFKD